MRVYVTVRSCGMRWICWCVSTKIESIPGVLVRLSPCARFPNSFPNARDHVCARIGSFTSFLYLVIGSPVLGCITGAQKCSHTQGMACDVGRGAYDLMAMALSAAVEYSRGESRAILGERRSSSGGCWTGVVELAMGPLVAAETAESVGGIVVGAGVGAGGGVLLRVCLLWMRGAVCVILGAVGLADVSSLSCRPPFEGCHGRVAGSIPGASVGGLPLNAWIAAIVVV